MARDPKAATAVCATSALQACPDRDTGQDSSMPRPVQQSQPTRLAAVRLLAALPALDAPCLMRHMARLPAAPQPRSCGHVPYRARAGEGDCRLAWLRPERAPRAGHRMTDSPNRCLTHRTTD
jgi:hypothetical protein